MGKLMGEPQTVSRIAPMPAIERCGLGTLWPRFLPLTWVTSEFSKHSSFHCPGSTSGMSFKNPSASSVGSAGPSGAGGTGGAALARCSDKTNMSNQTREADFKPMTTLRERRAPAALNLCHDSFQDPTSP